MRILLVQPDQTFTMGLQHAARLEPLGLEAVGAALRKRHEVWLLDLRVTPDALPAALADFRPDMLGISATFTVDTYRALRIARAAKEVNQRTFVFAGGHHASLCPTDFHHPAVDAVVLGEGELTAPELADCLAAAADPERVPGLVLNRPGGQHVTAFRAPAEDLDLLPAPDRTLSARYRREYYLIFTSPVASLETARGCPYRCRFCSVWRFYQKRIRRKSPSRVVEELAAIDEPYVFITDDNFLTAGDRAEEIARRIARSGIRKGYTIQARSDAIVRHAATLARWREVGLQNVFVGFEKPDQAGLAGVDKNNSLENNETALVLLRRLGIEPTVSFIVDPRWDRRDFAALRDYVRRWKLGRVAFTILTPLPGTRLFEDLRDRLTTSDRELFDLLHAVVPTRLPRDEFYSEVARLWKSVYPAWRLGLLRLYLRARRAWPRAPYGKPGWTALAEAARLADARSYLKPRPGFGSGMPVPQPGCRPNAP